MIRNALLAAALAAALPAGAIYKWVDENGVTQYTESPPPPGRAATKMTPSTTGPGGTTGQERKDDWKSRDLEQKRQKLEHDQADEFATRKAVRDAAVRSGKCLDARKQVETLGMARPIYSVNEKGERVYLEDSERARQLDEWRRQADKYCQE